MTRSFFTKSKFLFKTTFLLAVLFFGITVFAAGAPTITFTDQRNANATRLTLPDGKVVNVGNNGAVTSPGANNNTATYGNISSKDITVGDYTIHKTPNSNTFSITYVNDSGAKVETTVNTDTKNFATSETTGTGRSAQTTTTTGTVAVKSDLAKAYNDAVIERDQAIKALETESSKGEKADQEKLKELGEKVIDAENKVATTRAAFNEAGGSASAGSSSSTGDECAPISNYALKVIPIPDFKCVFATIGYGLIKAFSWLVSIAGWLFRIIFQFTVLDLKTTFGAVEGSVNTAWKVIRDLINMSFIFGLLYCAIMTILGDWVPNPVNTKKVVVSIIVGALLINFSLFFTKVVIDISNNFAVAIYNNITMNGANSLADGLFQSMGLQMVMSPDFIKGGSVTVYTKILLTVLLGCIMFLIAAGVFLTISLLLLTRFLTFLLLMIKSPLAFAGSAFPQLSKAAGDFWPDLTKQAIWAPVFLLMMWVVMKFTSGDGGLLGLAQGSANALGTTGTVDAEQAGLVATLMPIVLRFALVIGLLIFALKEAQSFASAGAAGMDKVASKVGKWGTGAMVGVSAFAGRQTIGRGASRLAERIAPDSRLGRFAKTNLNRVGGASFDLRSAPLGVGGVVGLAADKTGERKGGFAGAEKKRRERLDKYGEEVGKKTLKEQQEIRHRKGIADDVGALEAEHIIADHEGSITLAQNNVATHTAAVEASKERLADIEREKADAQARGASDLEISGYNQAADAERRTLKAHTTGLATAEKQVKEGLSTGSVVISHLFTPSCLT